jgi:succinyl-diaminopimelate desuccinylase
VLEPTGLRVRLGHRGVAWLRLTTCGRAAHASTPHLGENAIAAMARRLGELDALDHADHPLLGPSTLNVGRIEGGVAPNVVADRCTATIDVRMLPGDTAASWAERLDPGAEVLLALPAVATAVSPDVEEVARRLDDRPAGGAVPFFTDASVLAGPLDAPVLIWGPGDPAQAHTAGERCPVAEIAAAAERLAALPRALVA